MTSRLYYTDSYLTKFTGTVRSCEAQGDRFQVVLTETAFYPTSGGQPFDSGSLGGARVLDVIDRDDGSVVHVADRAIAAGEQIEGEIDWTRRFDHMQQHTGQHVLSAAFDRFVAARTESFHLGATSATIDLGRQVSTDEIKTAEDEANTVVWEDRPVAIRFATAEEAAALPLRKESLRTGSLRLIDVQDFDLSACGGTHVSRTGAIGVIAVTGWEKFRGGTRVEFLCGRRALRQFREWRDALTATKRLLSVSPLELASTIERLQADLKTTQRASRDMQEQLAVHEAHALVQRGRPHGDTILIVEALDGWDTAGLKALAAAVAASEPKAAVALFSHATPAIVVIARGRQASVDAAAVLKTLLGKFGGKGGGKADLAQGGGLAGSSDELLAAARDAMT